jgi:phosphopentomutase
MIKIERMILIVLDSLGVGAMPDFQAFGDPPGANTLGNVARQYPLFIPHFIRLGLSNICKLSGLSPILRPQAAFGTCALASPGKDTTTGHWELAGIILPQPLPLYPSGFPPEIIREFSARTGRSVLGNCAASGTEIIRQLGAEHLSTGHWIVYTSADSVFQIAAHEEVIPLAELYQSCETARQILTGPHQVGRVIARPFLGSPGAFTRTPNRRDYAIPPPPMLLDRLQQASVPVHAIGKISDIYLGRGITTSVKTKNNAEGMARTLEAAATVDRGLVFVNLVDFDQNFGHRNDAAGYARALEEFDAWLPSLEEALRPGDLVILTADHGCDPTTPSTDHTREYVPLLAFGPAVVPGIDLGLRRSLADIGQTIAQIFGLEIENGVSFLPQLMRTLQ